MSAAERYIRGEEGAMSIFDEERMKARDEDVMDVHHHWPYTAAEATVLGANVKPVDATIVTPAPVPAADVFEPKYFASSTATEAIRQGYREGTRDAVREGMRIPEQQFVSGAPIAIEKPVVAVSPAAEQPRAWTAPRAVVDANNRYAERYPDRSPDRYSERFSSRSPDRYSDRYADRYATTPVPHDAEWYNRSGLGKDIKGTIETTGQPEHIEFDASFDDVSYDLSHAPEQALEERGFIPDTRTGRIVRDNHEKTRMAIAEKEHTYDLHSQRLRPYQQRYAHPYQHTPSISEQAYDSVNPSVPFNQALKRAGYSVPHHMGESMAADFDDQSWAFKHVPAHTVVSPRFTAFLCIFTCYCMSNLDIRVESVF